MPKLRFGQIVFLQSYPGDFRFMWENQDGTVEVFGPFPHTKLDIDTYGANTSGTVPRGEVLGV